MNTDWILNKHKHALVFVVILILALNIYASFSQNELLLRVVKPLFIPFTVVYFYLTKCKLAKPIVAFFIFSFLGDFTSTIPQYSYIKLSSLLYCLSYFSLIGLLWHKIETIRFNALVYAYLITVFLICTYFIYQFYVMTNSNLLDEWTVLLFVLKSVILLVLGFFAFAVYLDTDSKSSILFLAMVFCFGFSDVLYYISQNYIYTWSFVVSEIVLHVSGLVLICNYIIVLNEGVKDIQVVSEKFVPQSL
ncbi:hypothetical protein [Lacinutrix salivirga]